MQYESFGPTSDILNGHHGQVILGALQLRCFPLNLLQRGSTAVQCRYRGSVTQYVRQNAKRLTRRSGDVICERDF